MHEDLRSVLTGALISLVLTILRQPQRLGREQTVRVFLLGLAVQSLHFMEEFLRTGFPPCSAFRRGQETFVAL